MLKWYISCINIAQHRYEEDRGWKVTHGYNVEGVWFKLLVDHGKESGAAPYPNNFPQLDLIVGNMKKSISHLSPGSSKCRTVGLTSDHCTVREFACGMSDWVNNLLMGILGNLTLLRLQILRDPPVHYKVTRLEASTQNAAFLLHLVMDFFAERRLFEKKVRLDQLSGDIKTLTYLRGTIDLWEFYLGLKSQAGACCIEVAAANLARLLGDVLQGIAGECRDLVGFHEDIDDRLSKVMVLLNKGFEVIAKLRRIAATAQRNECEMVQPASQIADMEAVQ